jgi:hypothetical protein
LEETTWQSSCQKQIQVWFAARRIRNKATVTHFFARSFFEDDAVFDASKYSCAEKVQPQSMNSATHLRLSTATAEARDWL